MPATESDLSAALGAIVTALRGNARQFALVGGLAVSVRAEVRFTRDVDLAVVTRDDADAEQLILALRTGGYVAIASVEHTTRARLSTVRLRSPQGVIVDLLFASCGIEAEIVARAEPVDLPSVGHVAVAAAEELVAMKVLSMTARRLQDQMDARSLLEIGDLDLQRVRNNLSLIQARGFHRDLDLDARLDTLLETLVDPSG